MKCTELAHISFLYQAKKYIEMTKYEKILSTTLATTTFLKTSEDFSLLNTNLSQTYWVCVLLWRNQFQTELTYPTYKH